MPLHNVCLCEILDLWGVDFMGLFPPSFGFTYILMLIEAIATRANYAKTMVKHVQTLILDRYGAPKATISDMGTPFLQ